MSKLNIYLCGQKYFGQAVLDLALELGHNVIGVSAPGGDDRLWRRAEHYGIDRQEAGQLTADTLPDGVDLIVAAHSHDFIGRKTRLRARIGAVGYHPSLLPLHRGRDAIRWSLRLGERLTGGSIYWLNDTVDGGPIAAQDWCFIHPDDTPETLWREKLQPMGLQLFGQVLGDIARGVIVQVPQDTALATWEPSLTPPPLRRPDLLMLGVGGLEGLKVVRSADALHRRSGAADSDDDLLACY